MVFCHDMIEHLDHAGGEELLRLVTARARRLAVFFTPLGPMLLNPTDPADHRSGWWPEEASSAWATAPAFPRFHDPWDDGLIWGGFYAWQWTRPEPAAAVRLAELTGHLGLLTREADLQDDAHLQGLDERQARHWRTLRDAYRPGLFGRGRPDVRTPAPVLARACVSRAARLLPGRG